MLHIQTSGATNHICPPFPTNPPHRQIGKNPTTPSKFPKRGTLSAAGPRAKYGSSDLGHVEMEIVGSEMNGLLRTGIRIEEKMTLCNVANVKYRKIDYD